MFHWFRKVLSHNVLECITDNCSKDVLDHSGVVLNVYISQETTFLSTARRFLIKVLQQVLSFKAKVSVIKQCALSTMPTGGRFHYEDEVLYIP